MSCPGLVRGLAGNKTQLFGKPAQSLASPSPFFPARCLTSGLLLPKGAAIQLHKWYVPALRGAIAAPTVKGDPGQVPPDPGAVSALLLTPVRAVGQGRRRLCEDPERARTPALAYLLGGPCAREATRARQAEPHLSARQAAGSSVTVLGRRHRARKSRAL